MPLEDPSFRFLCEAARAFLQGQPVSEEKLNESSELRRMALYHRLDPLFSETKQANQFRSLRLAAHLAKLAKEFETIGVPFLCLKGVVLAQQLWGDIGNRAAGDIDLWIAEDRMDDVHQLLTASGHVSKEGYFDLSESYRTSYRECKFHIGYNHEDTGISVEIHWRLGGTKTLFPLSFEEAFAKGVDVSISGFEYRTLSDLDNLVFLHMHAARHLWERLFWLLDLVKLHRNPKLPSSNSILERAADLNSERIVIVGLNLCHRLFDLEIPKSCQIEHSRDRGSRALLLLAEQNLTDSANRNKGIPSSLFFRGTMLLHPNWRHRKEVLKEFATAPGDWHHLRLRDGWFFLYIVLRPWLWLKKRFAGKS